MKVEIRKGFDDHHRPQVAALFWQAFSSKLTVSLGPKPKGLTFIAKNLHPQYALCAYAADGSLLGVVGFKTETGGLLGGTFNDMRTVYGTFGAIWRSAVLGLFDRELAVDTLQMDGLFVDQAARGQGVGTELLMALRQLASGLGKTKITLDVVDGNSGAKALYLKHGFQVVSTEHTGILRPLMGFSSAEKMVLKL